MAESQKKWTWFSESDRDRFAIERDAVDAEERALLASIWENPDDALNIDAYADYLLDKGRNYSSELVRSRKYVPGLDSLSSALSSGATMRPLLSALPGYGLENTSRQPHLASGVVVVPHAPFISVLSGAMTSGGPMIR